VDLTLTNDEALAKAYELLTASTSVFVVVLFFMEPTPSSDNATSAQRHHRRSARRETDNFKAVLSYLHRHQYSVNVIYDINSCILGYLSRRYGLGIMQSYRCPRNKMVNSMKVRVLDNVSRRHCGMFQCRQQFAEVEQQALEPTAYTKSLTTCM